MRSKDDRTTEHTTPEHLTGRGGDELEPIMDPAETLAGPEPDGSPATDMVDELLADPGAHAAAEGGERGVTTDDVLENIIRRPAHQ